MSTFVIVLAVVALVIVAVLLLAAMKPNMFEITRSTNIDRAADRVFPLINDLRAQTTWSPFEKDPNIKRVHSGAAQGQGAVYEWDGNREVGAGRIAIVGSTPSRITMDLQMLRPFACRNVVEYTLEPNGRGTVVTWAMRGARPFLFKVVSLFFDCDKMVARQFDEGLAKLKALAEA